MTDSSHPLPQKLALAHAGRTIRPIFGPFIDLDLRLAQFVSQAKEPILTQMRIAWWRDQLAKQVADRPQGDPILDALSDHWGGEEPALTSLVDGWEGLLADAPLPASAALDFVQGRAACFGAVARLAGLPDAANNAQAAGRRWAMADLAARMSDPAERDFVVTQAQTMDGDSLALPYRLRSLTILGNLGSRALDRGGADLIAGRRELLFVTRLGLFGR